MLVAFCCLFFSFNLAAQQSGGDEGGSSGPPPVPDLTQCYTPYCTYTQPSTTSNTITSSNDDVIVSDGDTSVRVDGRDYEITGLPDNVENIVVEGLEVYDEVDTDQIIKGSAKTEQIAKNQDAKIAEMANEELLVDYKLELPGGEYKDVTAYTEYATKRIPQRSRALLNGLASEILHEKMVASQYKDDKDEQ